MIRGDTGRAANHLDGTACKGFQTYRVAEVDLLKERHDVVIAIAPTSQHFQAQVEFGAGRKGQFFHTAKVAG